MKTAAIKTASVLESLLKARGAMYDALGARGVVLDKPEQEYAIATLLDTLLAEWDKDREIAESCRDTQRQHMSGAHRFGED